MARPQFGDYNLPYQKNYIDTTIGDNIIELIKNHSANFINFISNIPEEKSEFAYAENKWTVKEVLQHIIDTERVFVYRILRLVRKDAYAIPGFDQDVFAANTNAANRTLESLKNEFSFLRQSTDYFLLSLSNDDLLQKGIISNYSINVNSIVFLIFGHTQHHINIFKEKYLIE